MNKCIDARAYLISLNNPELTPEEHYKIAEKHYREDVTSYKIILDRAGDKEKIYMARGLLESLVE